MDAEMDKDLKETTVTLYAHEVTEMKFDDLGFYEIEVIAAALGAAISDRPELLGQMLEEMGYKLHEMSPAERLSYRQRILMAACHRGWEVVEFLAEAGAE